jgi:hypothetical protein
MGPGPRRFAIGYRDDMEIYCPLVRISEMHVHDVLYADSCKDSLKDSCADLPLRYHHVTPNVA